MKRIGTTYLVCATGGASGETSCALTTFIPGQVYSGVVGMGGSATSTTAGSSAAGLLGNNGETSAFADVSAKGGSGGATNYGSSGNVCLDGAKGGQGTCFALAETDSKKTTMPLEAPKYGELMPGAMVSYSYANGSVFSGVTNSSMCFNPFEMRHILGAGGNAVIGGSTLVQTAPILNDGRKAGDAAVSISAGDITAESATSPGCGGGAALLSLSAANSTYAVTSGAGADGAVYIYVRGGQAA